MNDKPLILVTNDDGVESNGIKHLIEVMRFFGEVVVVGPERAMSGMSAAITVENPLRVKILEKEEGYTKYQCNGTPVDCVKLAFNQLLDRYPDFVVSGINHGANSSISVMYSGTMGAAFEGCLHGVPSIGFSLCDYDTEADFSKVKIYVARIFQQVAENGLPPFVCLNVNFPKGEIRGIQVGRQASGKWVEEYDKRIDPHSRDYFWLTGHFNNFEPDVPGTDLHALENQFVSIVPVRVDMSCYETIEAMQNWRF